MPRALRIKSGPFKGLPRQHFRAICIDPPWKFKARTALQLKNWTSRRDVDKHYKTMTMEEIAALPVKDLAHPDGCHLFLCTTGPCLPHAIAMLKTWGFKYSSMAFILLKLKKSHNVMQLRCLPTIEDDFFTGLGLTTRKNVEYVILARRGNAKRISTKVRELLIYPLLRHSEKPDELFRRIQQYCAGPYAEIFSRKDRAGWVTWGDEKGKLNGGRDGKV